MVGILCTILFLSSGNYACKQTFLLPSSMLLGIGALLFAALGFLTVLTEGRLEGKLQDNPVPLLICCGVLFLFQLFFSWHTYFLTGWDGEDVRQNALFMATGNSGGISHFYFSICPNNLMLAWVFSLILRVASIFPVDVCYSLIVVQCVISTVTSWLLFQVCRELTQSHVTAWLTWFVYVLLIGVSPWVIISYSDATGLLFPLLLLWLYMKRKREDTDSGRWALLGFLTWFGYTIKPQTAIMAIAIWLAEIVGVFFKTEEPEPAGEANAKAKARRKKRPPKKKLWQFADRLWAFVLTFAVGMVVLNGMVVSASHVSQNRELALGPTHFLMMGLNDQTDGTFSLDDFMLSISIPTAQERRTENLRVSAQRLHSYGLGGLMQHLAKKTLVNYCDGTFAWGMEGEFFKETLPDKDTVFSPFFKSLFYPDGKRYTSFTTWMQVLWLGLLVGCMGMIGFLLKARETPQELLAALLAILGLTLFELLFEARARYLYTYAGVYVLLGIMGWRALFQSLPVGTRQTLKEN